jgi:hypothetical protein
MQAAGSNPYRNSDVEALVWPAAYRHGVMPREQTCLTCERIT